MNLHSPRREARAGRENLNSSGRRLWRPVLTGVLTLGLLLLGPGSPRIAAAQATAEARAALAAVMDVSSTLRSGLDRTRFDVDELSLELAFAEPEEIIELVRQQIAFEQYPGLLRGAQGTLVSGAGNALDQAVLLATLLGAAGFDVRIASGQLETGQAAALLQTMQPVVNRPAPPIEPAQTEELASTLGLDESVLAPINEEFEARLEALSGDANAVAQRLVGGLADAGLIPTDGSPAVGSDTDGSDTDGSDTDGLVAGLVAEAQQYFWVEYGLGGSGWTAEHVLFDEGEAPPVEAASYIEDTVPEELQHRFRFQVFVEQRLGDELEARPVMAAWERPTANLFGLGLEYFSLPDGFASAEPGADIDTVLAATESYTPVFNGAMAEGAMIFDLEGNTVDPMAAGNQAAGVFRNVGGAFGRAAGALAGEDDPDAFVALSAQWIEYTIIAPGGEETVHRRMVFDRVADRQSGSAALDPEFSDDDVTEALATSYSFMLDTGHYSTAYLTDRSLDLTMAAQPILEDALTQEERGQGGDMTVPLEFQEASRGSDLLQLYGAFDDAPGSTEQISYRAEPSLVVIERGWRGDRARVDVVANARRVLTPVNGALPQVDLVGAMAAGTWETRVESLPVAAGATTQKNTYSLLAEAWSSGATKVIAPADSEQVSGLELPAASRSAITEDLQRGFAVVVPTDAIAEVEDVAWWRVDPATGETLGRTADGRGGELTEYEQTLAVEKALTMGGHIIGGHTLVLGCVGKGSGIATACCLYEGVLISAGMVAIGAIIASSFAVSAVALFLLLDIGVGGAMTVAGFMDAMPTMCSGFAGTCRYRVVT